MALYVYISDACQDDARRHGQTEQLSKLKERVEKAQNLSGFDFPHPQFFKKPLGRSYRLIGYSVSFSHDELLLFLRILPRSDSDYDYFLKNLEQNEDAVIRRFQPYNDEELRQIYNQVKSVTPLPPLPELSVEERAWLVEVFTSKGQADDLIVLETETWVEKMKENSDFLGLYHRLLYRWVDLLSSNQLRAAADNTEFGIYRESDRDQGLGIAYLYRRDINRLLLLEPLRRTGSDAASLEKHKEKLSRIGRASEELLRVAARSYPFLMVLDENVWLAIQKNKEANLALSPEEAELLDSIRRGGAEDRLSYPLFINGRAGSGKSTMLQYLAADYIDFALHRGAGQRLLYITCSSDLLKRAREVVRQLLTIHHKRLLEGTHEPDKIDTFIERSFVVFHDFLYSLLPAEMQKQLPRDRYVDYSRFQRLWDEEFVRRQGARRMSPDVAWHTIRSYIKGIRSSCDDELSPEEFRTLPRRRRSVSEETYQQVYERVWQSWYKRLCDEKGYWDDQDLAACVLEKGLAQTVDCAALFCDEAQDFTPLELDIIYQLSLFGRRSLQPEELKRVPIVFAGDPLQTINPTGFRWDAVQADFHERFCAVLDPRRRARVDISHRELNFNYRSNPGVVHFCNLIQLARAALLGSPNITPQEAWWVDTPKIIHLAEDTEATRGIRQRPDFVKLVNCEEGEESDYVGKDPILSTLQENVEGVYRNVFSPMRAKGLEFPAVVLYRFGDTAPPDFERLLRGEIDIDTPEARLPYEYFFNRLYVAASRAKEDLVIVDSRDAIQRFWRFATEPEWADRLMQRVRNPEQWKGRIAHPVCGVEKWWEGERVDPLQQAQDYEREGRTKRDPYLLRQAALSYRSAGDESSAGRCLAFAAELESRYRDAGDTYRDLGLREDAFRCYWEGREWARLCDLAAPPSAFTNRLESRAADFMNRTAIPDSNFLNELIRAARDNDWFQRVLRDSVWYDVLVTLAQRLTTIKADETLPWRDIFEILQRFRTAGAHINNVTLATIAYRAHKLEEAVELWEDAGKTNHEEYYRAKARVTDFPENINWFNKGGKHSEVLRQWNRHHPSVELNKLEKSTILAVADSALEECKITLAIRMLQSVKMLQSADREIIKKLLVKTMEKGDSNDKKLAAVIAARLFVHTRDWDAAIRAAEHGDFSSLLGKGQAKNLQSMLRDTAGAANVFRTVVEELAGSERLGSETDLNKKPVAEFLYRNFVKEEGVSSERLYGLSSQVVGAALRRVDEALRKKAKDDLVDAIKRSDVESAQAAAVSTARLFVRTRDWDAAIRAAEHGDFSSLLGEQAKNLQSMLGDTAGAANVFCTIVEELAESENLAAETARSKDLADFLYRNFVKEEGVSSKKLHGLSSQVVGAVLERVSRTLREKAKDDLVDAIKRSDVESAQAAAVSTARLFVRTRDWNAAIRAAEHADFSSLLGEQAKNLQSMLRDAAGATNVFRTVVEELAGSENLVSETAYNKELVANFLYRNFIQEKEASSEKAGDLSLRIVGAAIERAGKIIDALKFYEDLQKSESEELKWFATERLVHNLERYAKYLGDKEKKEQAQEKQLRAQDIRKKHHLGDRPIPEYPVLSTDNESEEPLEWSLGPLKIVLSKVHGRLRIEHTKYFEIVTVDMKGDLRGDADYLQVKGKPAVWEIPKWHAKISLVDRKAGKRVLVEIDNHRREFSLNIGN